MAEVPELRALYRVEPADFVAARAALVKELHGAGRKDDARTAVKARKPTVPSWALDQVAQDRPELIEDLLDAGDALRDATDRTLGGDASNLRAATEAEQRATAAVIEAAAAHVPSLTTDHRERMTATLRAAILDDDVRAELVDGVLAADHDPPALGFAAAPSDAGTTPRPPARKAARAGSARAAKAELEADPAPPSSRRKIRRVGSPRSAPKAPPDEVDAKRRAKEVERLQDEEAERRRAEEAERERERRRKERQRELDAAAKAAHATAKELDAAAKAARVTADELAAAATQAAELADQARDDADRATLDADAAEQAAKTGPDDD